MHPSIARLTLSAAACWLGLLVLSANPALALAKYPSSLGLIKEAEVFFGVVVIGLDPPSYPAKLPSHITKGSPINARARYSALCVSPFWIILKAMGPKTTNAPPINTRFIAPDLPMMNRCTVARDKHGRQTPKRNLVRLSLFGGAFVVASLIFARGV